LIYNLKQVILYIGGITKMDCYKEMYFRLFNKITDMIHELQAVQIEVEEIYLSYETEGKSSEEFAKEDTAE
jgi:hypothetical protein